MQTASSVSNTRASTTATLPRLCFRLAAATIIIGMCLGMYMGIVHDFTLAPVHAHLNVLGWVSLFLLGLYYRAHPQAVSRKATVQVWGFILGYIYMTIGMAGMFLTAHPSFLPLAIVGGVVLIGSMVLFLVICWSSGD